MNSINQRDGRFVQVPKELYRFFTGPDQRVIINFFETLAKKLDNTSVSLSEVEQRGGIPSISRTVELSKEIEAIVKGTVAPLRGRIMELEKQIADMERSSRR